MPKPIINIADIELQSRPAAMAPTGEAAQRFNAKMGSIGTQIGARLLGYNITEVPPGKRSFPRHNHRVNEEMFFILEGSGEVRIGDEVYPVTKGDIIACPPGGPDTAHQIFNTGSTPIKYLAVSTKMTPELVEYPDSGKFGILAEFPEQDESQKKTFRFISRENASIGYWEGE